MIAAWVPEVGEYVSITDTIGKSESPGRVVDRRSGPRGSEWLVKLASGAGFLWCPASKLKPRGA